MTRLLLLGGHVVEVKAKGEEVRDRLAKAGWMTHYHERQPHDLNPAWTHDEPGYAEFEKSKGRGMIRVRTDAVLAIDG